MNIRKSLARRLRPVLLIGAAIGVLAGTAYTALPPASAASYVPVSGAGSTWSANAIDQWISDVKQYGMRINYEPTGSATGRQEFLQQTVDFSASDIPFQTHPEDGSAPENPTPGSYAYVPITAGGTTFMYNLVINGQRVTNLRLSGQNIAKIFTGQIVNWDDPAIKQDNPQLALPNKPITPVVRSDGSGSTAQFTLWMINQYPSIWNAYCSRAGRSGSCGSTEFYPTISGMVAQNGDLGVASYVAQSFATGSIGYVQYSYALGAGFPVAKMLNAAGYYTEPTPQNVAVSLLKAQVDTTDTDPSLYLTQKLDQVYVDTDPRVYPLSSYSYLIIPTKAVGSFSTAKGDTLAAFMYYGMCQGQQEMGSIGYSPMPINLVQDTFTQIAKIPGAVVQNINIQSCHNPTFSADGTNLLATTDPVPPACDKQGSTQCATGTGGDKNPTTLTGGSNGGGGTGGGGNGGGGNGGGGGTGGNTGGNGGGTTGGTTGHTGSTSSSKTGSGSTATGGTNAGGTNTASSNSDCAALGTCTSSGSNGSDNSSSGGNDASLAVANAYTIGSNGGGSAVLWGLCGILGLAVILLPGLMVRSLRAKGR